MESSNTYWYTLFENRCRYKKTVPQLLIRWSFQKDYITIPKSSKPERIQENADIFDFTISDEDMKTLVGFTQNNCNYRQQTPFSFCKSVRPSVKESIIASPSKVNSPTSTSGSSGKEPSIVQPLFSRCRTPSFTNTGGL